MLRMQLRPKSQPFAMRVWYGCKNALARTKHATTSVAARLRPRRDALRAARAAARLMRKEAFAAKRVEFSLLLRDGVRRRVRARGQ